MGQITSGVGLISGINTADLINQLLAIEARPKQLVQQRSQVLTTQQVAFQDISAKLLVLKLSASAFSTRDIFGTTAAASSDDTVLTATTSASAIPGTYDFTVDRLVSSQQIITNGFADTDTSAIATSGGTLNFEFGDSRLNADTPLNQLNGGAGITRGKIRVTDRSGASAVVDLSKALTTNDVLDAINNASGISVTASVSGDAFRIVDGSGGAGTLSVTDVSASGTAASLGLNTAAVGTTLTGLQVNRVGTSTSLVTLNDGNGVRARTGVADFRVTRRDGTTFDVNLDGASSLGSVITAINSASGGNVTASINSAGTGLQLVDTSTSNGTILQVTAINSSNAAVDLGILTTDANDDGTLVGGRVIAGLNSRLVGSLRGGQGTTLGVVNITNRAGALTGVNLSSATSVADIIDLINNAGAGVTASVNSVGTGLLLTDTTGSTASNLIVADSTGTAATDLNLAGSVAATTIDSGNLQLQYISEATRLASLNGGAGVAKGRFTITDSNGVSATVDLTQGEQTIQEVLNEINSRGLAINGRINDNGDGILIEDTGNGTTKLKVEEAGSTTARDLGLLGEADNLGDDLDIGFERSLSIASVVSLTGATLLSSLNGGAGVDNQSGQDDFSFTTRSGSNFNVNIDGVTDITGLISAINTASGGSVTAAISASGTGLRLTDNTSGSNTFLVSALNNSDAAEDLGIETSDTDGDGIIGGSAIVKITTLEDLADQINSLGINVRATLVNDGSVANPYRLSLQSTKSGKAGAFVFDDGGLGFGASTLVDAKDAVVFFGSPDPARALAVTSTSNTLTSVVPGATIDLKTTKSSPVQLTITRDDSAIVDAVKKFVDDFNTVTSKINELDSYNSDTQKRGLLLGDSVIASVRSSLFRLVNSRNGDVTGQFVTLAQVGVTVGSGSRLRFDETRFRNALASDITAAEQLFTLKETTTDSDTGEVTLTKGGILPRIDDLLDSLTNSISGLVPSRVRSLDNQLDLNTKRIAQLDAQLEAKRARLQAQFNAMESALAQLQQQNTAISSLQSNLANISASRR